MSFAGQRTAASICFNRHDPRTGSVLSVQVSTAHAERDASMSAASSAAVQQHQVELALPSPVCLLLVSSLRELLVVSNHNPAAQPITQQSSTRVTST